MDSQVAFRIKAKLQRIIKGKKVPAQDNISKQDTTITPKFSEEVKLPSLSPNRSVKILPKPYPITRININPVLKESASLITIKNPAQYRYIKNSRIIDNKSIRHKLDISADSIRGYKFPGILNRNLIETNERESQTPLKSGKLKTLYTSPEFDYLNE